MVLVNMEHNFSPASKKGYSVNMNGLLHGAPLKAVGYKFCLFFACCLAFLNANGQQTFSYTQYMNNLVPINPAYAVVDNTARIDLLARRQWAGVNGAPTTLFFNGNIPIPSLNGATGLIVENDQFGVENLTEFNAFYAQSVKLGDNQFLAVSFTLGYKNYVANYSQLDPADPALSPDVRENKANVGFGVMYYAKDFYLGVSVPELTLRNLGEASLLDNNYFRNNYFITGGVTVDVADGLKFKPAALVSYTRGVPLITDVSATLLLKDFLGIGANYRTNNDAALIVTMDFSSFYVGYSYQFGLSSTSIGGYSNATQEVTLGFRFGSKTTHVDVERKPKVF
jgi:type IX secretion system PorP/SprF family membrane protein